MNAPEKGQPERAQETLNSVNNVITNQYIDDTAARDAALNILIEHFQTEEDLTVGEMGQ